ncbi:FGGY-family carbohydrate kinase [Actinacidiphila sp. bgisy144]|uniref:FGGY-family carbohydrate kinase n=1 Tax=Actinacidiphila sp. bgisy144 TaxID=3413791 RepID=UPI003EC070FA
MTDTPGQDLWVGIDLGTQGVRALVVTGGGQVLGRGSAPLTGHRDGHRHEQRPSDWWQGVTSAVAGALRTVAPARVRGLAVCATSGTVLLTDPHGEPLTPALMYDDGRASAEARFAQETGAEVWDALGYRIQPSWGLAKLLWLAGHQDRGGAAALRGARVCHQADFVTSRLVGHPVAADSSHALKTGYDLRRREWPHALHEQLGLAELEFPPVVAPGSVLGTVCAQAAAATGLTEGTPVVAGMTDGCAAQLGSGAWDVGQWNSVLGTTLVLKGVTAQPLTDPAGVLYNHRAADGNWLPGGASSVGAGALARAFPGADLARLDRAAAAHEPASVLSYPLVSRGERFPFLAPDAEPFTLGTPSGDADLHASLLQGVAYVERLCLAYVRQLGARIEGPVAFTGGATGSAYWNQLRADVLGRQAAVPEHADSALGMAVLAAHGAGPDGASGSAGASGPDGWSRLRPMVKVRTVLDPRPEASRRFDEPFRALLDAWEHRGWLPAQTAAYAREHG